MTEIKNKTFKFNLNNIIISTTDSIIENKYCLYKIINKINNKSYIGKHKYKESPIDSYAGSGICLKKAYDKYGINNFTKEILEINIEEEDINKKEKDYIKSLREKGEAQYNIASGGDGGKTFKGEINPMRGWQPSEETRKKMSESHKGQIQANKGKKLKGPALENVRKAALTRDNSYRNLKSFREKCKISHLKRYEEGRGTFPNKNKICINNGITCKFIEKDDKIPDGWEKGGLKSDGRNRPDSSSIEYKVSVKLGKYLKSGINNLIKSINPEETRSWKNLRLKEEYNLSDIEINNFIKYHVWKRYLNEFFTEKLYSYETSSTLLKTRSLKGEHNPWFEMYKDYYSYCVVNGLYGGDYNSFKEWEINNLDLIYKFFEEKNLTPPIIFVKRIFYNKCEKISKEKGRKVALSDYLGLINLYLKVDYSIEDFINFFDDPDKNLIKTLINGDICEIWKNTAEKARRYTRENT